MQQEIARLETRYGTVPPPWVVFPDIHPYSVGWRMGVGEGFLLLWGAWWERQAQSEPDRVAYFRRFPPPPRWLEWMLDALWSLNLGEEDEPDLDPYFAHADALGFGTRDDERDLDDPRWLEG